MKVFFICFLIQISFCSLLYSQVNTEVYRKKKDGEKNWYASADASLTLQKGNSDTLNTINNVRIDYMTEKYFAFIVGNISWGESNGKVDTSKGFAHLRGGREFFTSSVYMETFGQVEYNSFIKMKMRDLAGLSFRIRVLKQSFDKDEESFLIIYAAPGMMYEYEYLDTEKIVSSEKNPSHTPRMTSYISLKFLWRKHFSLNAVSYYQPDILNWRDFRVISNFTMKVSIFENLGLFTKFGFRYDNDPPELRTGSLDRYDIELINGLEISF